MFHAQLVWSPKWGANTLGSRIARQDECEDAVAACFFGQKDAS
jgi:hypothetical protein